MNLCEFCMKPDDCRMEAAPDEIVDRCTAYKRIPHAELDALRTRLTKTSAERDRMRAAMEFLNATPDITEEMARIIAPFLTSPKEGA